MEIKKIWIEEDKLFGLTDDGKELWQSLLYYPRLLHASGKQRMDYEINVFGIHWNEIDEDVSFESFEYDNPEPKGISRVLLSIPELNLSALACRLNIQQSLLAAYKNGTKIPSKEREKAIIQEIHAIGNQLASIRI